jgi:hypothetical protein
MTMAAFIRSRDAFCSIFFEALRQCRAERSQSKIGTDDFASDE